MHLSKSDEARSRDLYFVLQWVCVTAGEVNASRTGKEAEDFDDGLGHLGMCIFYSAFMIRLVLRRDGRPCIFCLRDNGQYDERALDKEKLSPPPQHSDSESAPCRGADSLYPTGLSSDVAPEKQQNGLTMQRSHCSGYTYTCDQSVT